ncbi:MAG: hypothetical protein ACLR43_00995 [Faecalibacillus faecis]
MVELSNDLLTVSLHPKGAEIISIKGKRSIELYVEKRCISMGKQCTYFISNCWSNKNDTCVINGKEYHMTQHGFARHNEFEQTKLVILK